jgi:polyferredoxin
MAKRQKVRRAIILVSFLLFPIIMDYFSPYLIINGALYGVIVGSFITFTLLFLVSLFLGRAFCGWACPGAGLQEACFYINDKKVKGGKLNWIKYFIWIPWITIIVIMAFSAGGFHSINPFYMMEKGISVSEPSNYVMYYFVILLFLVPSLAIGKRAFCHYMCWIAPFMIIGAKIKNAVKLPSLHLEAITENCKDCSICDRNCPMSLNVSKMVKNGSMENSECTICGTCADSCLQKAIICSWGYKR